MQHSCISWFSHHTGTNDSCNMNRMSARGLVSTTRSRVALNVSNMTSIGQSDGGFAGFSFMYILARIGSMYLYASMDEMGSMAPTAGG